MVLPIIPYFVHIWCFQKHKPHIPQKIDFKINLINRLKNDKINYLFVLFICSFALYLIFSKSLNDRKPSLIKLCISSDANTNRHVSTANASFAMTHSFESTVVVEAPVTSLAGALCQRDVCLFLAHPGSEKLYDKFNTYCIRTLLKFMHFNHILYNNRLNVCDLLKFDAFLTSKMKSITLTASN